MNVLITSTGRRTSLLQSFKEAVHRNGGKVFAGDKDSLAPSLYLADRAFQLPEVTNGEYVPYLLSLVREHRIKLIVPVIDTELPVLAEAAPLFQEIGCHALVSSAELVRVAGDKWLTEQFFSAKGVSTPRSWVQEAITTGDLPAQLFVKPRDGSASENTYSVHRDRLSEILALVPNPIIQEKIEGSEITIDALIDLKGELIHYVPRLRIRTMSGESIQGVTLPDEELRTWLVEVLEATASIGARGPVTAQAFLTTGGPILTEINPRFGGGFPLTHAAGGHYPEWLLRMVRGEDISPRLGRYQKGLYMTRYYVEHFTEEPLW